MFKELGVPAPEPSHMKLLIEKFDRDGDIILPMYVYVYMYIYIYI